MHVRPATTRDLRRLAEITVTSLKDDPAFDYMWPSWKRYPEDNAFFWQRQLQKWLYDRKTMFIVAVLDADDADPNEKQERSQDLIVSYCIWERLGSSKSARRVWRRKNTLTNVVDGLSTSLQDWSLSKKYVRRDANFDHLQALADAQRKIGFEHWNRERDLWNLELIVTDRPYRRMGAASMLVTYGTDLADRDGLACRVEASPLGKLLYESCDFKDLGDWTVKAGADGAELLIHCMRRNPKQPIK